MALESDVVQAAAAGRRLRECMTVPVLVSKACQAGAETAAFGGSWPSAAASEVMLTVTSSC